MSVKTALYAVRVTPLVTDDALFEKALAAVTPARREKAMRYRRREDAALSLGAGLLLRYAFAKAGKPVPKRFGTSSRGKPFAEELRFNLSHSGEWAICAVADVEVGCDVEKIDPAHTDVAKRVFTAAENARLDAAKNETERTRCFFRLWTLKESYMKATDAGLALSDFSVCLGEPSTVDGKTVTCGEYDDLPGYACALCLCGDESCPPLFVISTADLL